MIIKYLYIFSYLIYFNRILGIFKKCRIKYFNTAIIILTKSTNRIKINSYQYLYTSRKLVIKLISTIIIKLLINIFKCSLTVYQLIIIK